MDRLKKKLIFKGMVFTLLAMILASCSLANERGGNLGKEADWVIGQGELLAYIGHPDEEQVISDLLNLNRQDLLERMDYVEPTGRWFLSSEGGSLGFGISSGTLRAGDEVYVSLIAPRESVEVNRDVRIQLMQLTKQDEAPAIMTEITIQVGTIDNEKRIFTTNLSDDENTAYILSAEIISDSGEVEDILITIIYVPIQEMNASLTMDRSSYSLSDHTATLTLKNAGPTVLTFGLRYTIEKLVDGTWRIVPLDLNFNDIGIMVSPGHSHEQSIHIDQLSKGHYRVYKHIWAEGTELETVLAAEFVRM